MCQDSARWWVSVFRAAGTDALVLLTLMLRNTPSDPVMGNRYHPFAKEHSVATQMCATVPPFLQALLVKATPLTI